MRIPIPILGALALALAAVYLVTVYTQFAAAVVNATTLDIGQNVTTKLGYVPHMLQLYLDPSGTYSIMLHAPGVDMAVDGTVVHETFTATVTGQGTVVLHIDVVRAPPGKPSLKVVVVRTA